MGIKLGSSIVNVSLFILRIIQHLNDCNPFIHHIHYDMFRLIIAAIIG
jgi:hypothetical protein